MTRTKPAAFGPPALIFLLGFSILTSSCQLFSWLFPVEETDGPAYSTAQVLIPGVSAADSGLQASPAPSGSVIYFDPNSYEYITRSQSEIQLSSTMPYQMTAKRYLPVNGQALSLNAADSSVEYHNVFFSIYDTTAGGSAAPVAQYHFPVDQNNNFSGYLYFPAIGSFYVYAWQSPELYLYPRESRSVPQFSSALVFIVNVTEAVPAELHYLLPTERVDVGTQWVRDYATSQFGHLPAGEAQVRAVYEQLADYPTFSYKFYNEISYPGLTSFYESEDISWTGIFCASDFLRIKQGVCNDFAEGFAALTRVLGYKVQFVSGDTHEWNQIFIDGRWRSVDATWANNYSESPSGAKDIGIWADLGYDDFSQADFDDAHAGYFPLEYSY